MIVPMAKARVIGPKSLRDHAAAFLQAAGIVHLESPSFRFSPEDRHLVPAEPDEKARNRRVQLERLGDTLRRLSLLLPSLSLGELGPPLRRAEELLDLAADLEPLVRSSEGLLEEVVSLSNLRTAYRDEMEILARYQAILTALGPIFSALSAPRDVAYVGLTVRRDQAAVLDLIEERLGRLTRGEYEMFTVDLDAGTAAVLIVVSKSDVAKIRGFLLEESIPELRLPGTVAEKPLVEALQYLALRQAELPAMLAGVEGEIRLIGERHRGWVSALRREVENALEMLRAEASFLETRSAFVANGWVPSESVEALRRALAAAFGGRVLLETLPFGRGDSIRAPVLLRNPRMIRPFQVLLSILPLPRYRGIDPTPFLAVFFPVFFGLILGDIGYGLLAFALALVLRRRYKKSALARDAFFVLAVCAVSAAVFGLLFGEFFGELGRRAGLAPLLFDRSKAILLFLKVSIVIGVVHLVLGLSLGLVASVREGDRAEAVGRGAKILFVVMWGVIAAGYDLRVWSQGAFQAGAAGSLVLLVVLGLSAGFVAPIELLGLLSNVLSYARIMAFGVASVYIAFVANTLAARIEYAALGVLVGFLFHMLGLVVGIVDPAIQSLRLHYVEFFGKFYQPGGRPFAPLRRAGEPVKRGIGE